MTEKPEPRYQVTVERTSAGTFVARNRRGGEIRFSTGDDGEGEGADKARALLPEAVRLSHDRLCTVSNTVRRGTPVKMAVADPSTRSAPGR
jgi:putative redox protein